MDQADIAAVESQKAEMAAKESTEGLVFYRCVLCTRVVNKWQVESGEGCKCGGMKVKPTNLTWLEKLVQLVKHPKVWQWPR